MSQTFQIPTDSNADTSSARAARLSTSREWSAAATLSTQRGVVQAFLQQLKDTQPDSPPPTLRATVGLFRPSAYRILSRLCDTGVVSFTEIEEHMGGWEDWMGLADLVQAGYAAPGKERLHLSQAGRDALERFNEAHPEIAPR